MEALKKSLAEKKAAPQPQKVAAEAPAEKVAAAGPRVVPAQTKRARKNIAS
jgi:hypothetical protein